MTTICVYLDCSVNGYVTINISSPNTKGIRDFQHQKELEKLLTGINKIKKIKIF